MATATGTAPSWPASLSTAAAAIDAALREWRRTVAAGANCHVDACIGGWLLPYFARLGMPVLLLAWPLDASHPLKVAEELLELAEMEDDQETADAVGTSPATVKRQWAMARACGCGPTGRKWKWPTGTPNSV